MADKFIIVIDGNEIECNPESKIQIKPFSVKNIWKSVEYAKNKKTGKIINLKHQGGIILCKDEFGQYIFHQNYEPSNYEDYLCQINNEFVENFGQINSDQKFREPYKNEAQKININAILSYDKNLDVLAYGGVILYNKGKWAIKVL